MSGRHKRDAEQRNACANTERNRWKWAAIEGVQQRNYSAESYAEDRSVRINKEGGEVPRDLKRQEEKPKS